MSSNKFFGDFKKIHFIGIGGISLSALAKLSINKGIEVSGSDLQKSEITEKLKKLGIDIFYSHKAENVKDVSLIVFSGAIKKDNPEIIYAKKMGIKMLERSDYLKEIAKEYENVISIAGSHGKTTTTAMIGIIFSLAGKMPTVHVGGIVKNFKSNLLTGGKEYFITEACEYNKSFLKLPTTLGVILNIDNDHPDCYKNLQEIEGAFKSFYNNSTEGVVINKQSQNIINKQRENSIAFGLKKDCNFSAKNIKINKENKLEFSAVKNGSHYARIDLNCYGRHNVYNALATIAVCDYYGIDKKIIKKGLKIFDGIKRRFECIKTIGNQIIFHDYAHHPTEIKSAIAASKGFNKKIMCVFQPHTYTRTQSLMSDFLTCFKGVDELIILPTYAAREKEIVKANSKSLYKQIKKHNNFKCKYMQSFESVSKYISKNFKTNQVVLILGAGDIENLAYKHL